MIRKVDVAGVPRNNAFWQSTVLVYDAKAGALTRPERENTFKMGARFFDLAGPVTAYVQEQTATLTPKQVAQLSVNVAQLNTQLDFPVPHPLQYATATPRQKVEILSEEIILLGLAQQERARRTPRVDADPKDLGDFKAQVQDLLEHDASSFEGYYAEMARISQAAYELGLPNDAELRRPVARLMRLLRAEEHAVEQMAITCRARRGEAMHALHALQNVIKGRASLPLTVALPLGISAQFALENAAQAVLLKAMFHDVAEHAGACHEFLVGPMALMGRRRR